MLDSSEGVCPGQARFEYPATSVLFSMCSHRVQLCILILRSVSSLLNRPFHVLRSDIMLCTAT